MKKIIIAILISHIMFYISQSIADQTSDFLAPNSYNMMEPFMNEKMRQKLKPKNSEYMTKSSNQIATTRKVIARSATGSPSQTRKVVSRASSLRAREVLPTNTNIVGTTGILGNVTVPQCLENYTDCMDGYCHRTGTKYDRCYCSSKLAQLDGQFKPQIDDLVKRIIIAQNGGVTNGGMTQEEINELWNELFGASGGNSMADLDAALDIDWAGTESAVRGQNAFVAGDNFCKQQLERCFYMAENLKSMYRSTIGQDCKKYENHLQKLKSAAEQVLANYE